MVAVRPREIFARAHLEQARGRADSLPFRSSTRNAGSLTGDCRGSHARRATETRGERTTLVEGDAGSVARERAATLVTVEGIAAR